MKEDNDLMLQIVNDEITRLRKSFCNHHMKDTFDKGYDGDDIDRAFMYFLATPSIQTYNRNHIDILIECCESAKSYRLSK